VNFAQWPGGFEQTERRDLAIHGDGNVRAQAVAVDKFLLEAGEMPFQAVDHLQHRSARHHDAGLSACQRPQQRRNEDDGHR
jgi:hypothetical protein